jgi:hypothetical protein
MSFDIGKVFAEICKAVETPFAKNAFAFYESKDYEKLIRHVPLPKDYDDAQKFADDYLVSSYLKKYKGFQIGSPSSVALASFTEAESICELSNRLLKLSRLGEFHFPLDVNGVIHSARRKIEKVVRGFDGSDLKRFEFTTSRFGPGATFDLKGRQASLYNKVLSTSVTRRAVPYALALLRDRNRFQAITNQDVEGDFCVLPSILSVVPGNRVTTVPKTALTDRVIAIEPSLNIELQLAVGAFIRERLKTKAGVNLDSQSKNQFLASVAHKDSLCTIDLSSASDTVCKELIFELFPLDFAEVLNDLRCHKTRMPGGKWVENEKFSSMGNGFTFELESLIFWAITASCDEDGWGSVYGDDIICRRTSSELLVKTLTCLGFVVNKSKSYFDGDFFESCGKHFFKGIDVTPIYQKEVPDTLDECYRAANRISRYDYMRENYQYCELRRFRPAWLAVIGQHTIHHLMPLADRDGVLYEGDGGLAIGMDDFFENIRSVKKVPQYVFRPKLLKFGHLPLLAESLRRSYLLPLSEGISIRRVGKFVQCKRDFSDRGVSHAGYRFYL